MLAGNIAGETRTLPLAIYSEVAAGKMSAAYKYVWIIVAISFIVVVLMNVLAADGKTEGQKREEPFTGREKKIKKNKILKSYCCKTDHRVSRKRREGS